MDAETPKAKILTIDDEPVIRGSFRCHLEDLDYAVVEASNGRQGLEAFDEHTPDLVLVDLRMPEMSGLEFLEQVRQRSPETPVIVISGTGMIRDVVDALRLGAWDYLTKPVEDLSVLTHAVEKSLERARLRRENLAYQKHLESEVARRTHELELALKSVRQSRNQLDAILKSMADGLLVTDMDGRVIVVNRMAQHLLQIQFEQAFDQPIDHTLSDPLLLETIDLALEGETDVRDWRLVRPEWPQEHIFLVRSHLAYGEDGTPIGVITLLRDVTRERESDRVKNKFISTAAHELNTPLTSILGYAELLLQKTENGQRDPSQQQEFLHYIVEKAEHLSGMVDELLDLGRIQSGRQIPLHPAPGRLDQMLEEAVAHSRDMASGHQFLLQIDTPCPILSMDIGKMRQVVDNLLTNAVKYSPAGGKIRIRAGQQGDCYRFSIADKGIGMSAEEAKRMFDNFFRADSSDTAVGGLGLGLAVVKAIVEAHEGRVWVESELGLGTTVFVELPLTSPGSPPLQ